jgi:drug/metabolite transporter (DMT)-like permease
LLAVAFALLRPPLPDGRARWLALVTGGALVQGLYFALLYLALDLENRFGVEAHPVTANLVSCSVALLLTAAAAAAFEDPHVDWTTDLAISLAYLVVANTLVSITLLLAMLRNGEAARVSALFFLVPPLAALIAWVMLGEDLDDLAWAGMAVAALGVGIATRGEGQPPENAPRET